MQPEDGKFLAAELGRLATDSAYLKTLEENARRAVEERYSLDSMIDKLTSLYREVAA
jgi:glycosyltransferase involved in cell wall biosynthesis